MHLLNVINVRIRRNTRPITKKTAYAGMAKL